MKNTSDVPTASNPKPQTTYIKRKEIPVTCFNNLRSASKAVLTIWIYFAFASRDLPLNIKALPTVTFF